MRYALILSTLFSSFGYSQFVATGAYKAQILFSPTDYYQNEVIARNSNDTYDYYIAHHHLNPMVYSISLRSFGKKYFEEEKTTFGYSLEIGFQHFTSSATLLYDYSSTNYRDSIINALNGYQYKTNYTTVLFNHFLDFNYPINESMKFIASVGIGITALMRSKSATVPNASMIDADYPVTANLVFEPQIVEKYKRFDVGYFFSFHLHGLALYNWKDNDIDYGDTRIKMADLRFNGIGIRFIPHPRPRDPAFPEETF